MCSYTRNLIQISWRETSVIKVYHVCFMILKDFPHLFFFTSEKNHENNMTKTPFNTHQKQTKLPMAGMACFGFLSHFVLGWSRSSCFCGCLGLRKISKLHGQGDPIATWDLIWQFLFGGGMIFFGFVVVLGGGFLVGFTVFSVSEMCSGGWTDFSHQVGKRGREYEDSLWIAMNLRYLPSRSLT